MNWFVYERAEGPHAFLSEQRQRRITYPSASRSPAKFIQNQFIAFGERGRCLMETHFSESRKPEKNEAKRERESESLKLCKSHKAFEREFVSIRKRKWNECVYQCRVLPFLAPCHAISRFETIQRPQKTELFNLEQSSWMSLFIFLNEIVSFLCGRIYLCWRDYRKQFLNHIPATKTNFIVWFITLIFPVLCRRYCDLSASGSFERLLRGVAKWVDSVFFTCLALVSPGRRQSSRMKIDGDHIGLVRLNLFTIETSEAVNSLRRSGRRDVAMSSERKAAPHNESLHNNRRGAIVHLRARLFLPPRAPRSAAPNQWRECRL